MRFPLERATRIAIGEVRAFLEKKRPLGQSPLHLLRSPQAQKCYQKVLCEESLTMLKALSLLDFQKPFG